MSYPYTCDIRVQDTVSTRFRWTVVCRRFDGSGDFNRSWIEYKNGFGDVSGEAWLGNEYLHYLTNTRSYKLRFDLEDWDGNTAYAEYSSIVVTSEADQYRLLLGDYSGTSSFYPDDDRYDGFLYHNNSQFSTFDQDNAESGLNCAVHSSGGFWHRACYSVGLTANYCPPPTCNFDAYHRTLTWGEWGIYSYSLKTITMRIKPVA